MAGVVCLAGWQVWLTARLLEQDRNLELQRTREHLGETADLAMAKLVGTLGDWDFALHDLNALPPSSALLTRLPKGATFILVSRSGIEVWPRRPVLFVPVPPQVREAELQPALQAADQLEFREQQFDRAIALLQPLALRPDTRGEALLRIARIESKSNRKLRALETYQALKSQTILNPAGTPYALLALTARCRLLRDLGRESDARAEAAMLRDRLLEGRWPLSREVFEYYWSELGSLDIAAGQPPRGPFRRPER